MPHSSCASVSAPRHWWQRTEAQTIEPMKLGEFAGFFVTAWPLIEVLEMNFEDDVEGALDFFSADSDFYPALDSLCRQRVRDHFRAAG